MRRAIYALVLPILHGVPTLIGMYMRFGIALASIAALTASLMVPALAAPNNETALAQWRSGVDRSVPGLSVGPEVGWNAGLTSLAPPGANYYRLWDMKTSWRDVNPAEGVFDWSILDRRIAQVEAWGGKPILVLGLTPQWAALDPDSGDPRWGAGSSSPPKARAYWDAYVSAVADRYGARIAAYEVWNEANLTTFWMGSPEEMAALTQSAFSIIKAKSPSSVVLSPSVTTRLKSGANLMNSLLKLMPSGPTFDAFAIHTYPRGDAGADPVSAAQARFDDISAWQEAVVGNVSDRNIGIWDTEINYGLAGPGVRPHTDFSDADAAKLLSLTYADSAVLGIDVTVWYEFTAEPFDLLGAQFTPQTPAMASTWQSLTTGGSPLISVNCSKNRAKPLFTFTCTDFGDIPVGSAALLQVLVTNESAKSARLVPVSLPVSLSAANTNGSLREVVRPGDCGVNATPGRGTCTLHYLWTPVAPGPLSGKPIDVAVCKDASALMCYRTAKSAGLRGNATQQ